MTPIDTKLRKDLLEYLEKVALIDGRASKFLERLRPKKRGRKKGYRKPSKVDDSAILEFAKEE